MGAGSEGSAGALVFFFAVGFLVTAFVEGEGSVTGGGGWADDEDLGSFAERIP